MVDFERARQVMVDGQIRAGGVTESRLLSRFVLLPREIFVPEARRELAYVDDLHWFGRAHASRFMPAPAILARLLHLAEITAADSVLDVGATTGYASAIAAGLADSVTGLEQDETLAAAAAVNLAGLALSNATIVSGSTAQFGHDRFDVIFVQGMLDSMPADLFSALRPGGRLVALIRKGPIGTAHVFIKSGGKVTARAEFNAFLPPLSGVRQEQEFVF